MGTNLLAWMKVIAVLAVLALVAWLYFKIKTVGESVIQNVDAAIQTVNPMNENNVIKKQVDRALSSVVGREESLGGWFYSILNPDPVEQMIAQQLEQNPWQYPSL